MTNKIIVTLSMLLLAFAGCSSGSDVVSKAEYDQISEGMSESDVDKIVGETGTEIASNKIDGVPGVIDSISTKSCSWQNSDGSNMNAIFQNGKLMQKAQFGLK